ncbi:MAG: hypothetical protein CMN30_20620 [Sandaracinus sp.]|nr:hypothetical protein [Sandaracinus sp.]
MVVEATRTRLALDNLVATAQRRGLLLDRPTGEGTDLRARVPMTALYETWETLDRAGIGPEFALEVADHSRGSSKNLVRMVAGSAPDLAGALRAAARYWPLVTDAHGIEVQLGRSADLIFGPVPERLGARRDLLFSAVAILRYLQRWSPTAPLGALHLRESPWPATARSFLERELGVAIHFGAAADRIHLEAPGPEGKLRGSDDGLHTVLTERAEALLATVGPSASVLARVWDVLPEVCRAEAPQRAAARALGTSPRSLRRALTAEGTSFAAELDRFRASRAGLWLHALDDRALAERLGFADARSFRRAFVRWNQCTPAAARDLTPR